MEGVVYDVPVANAVPPDATLYHEMVDAELAVSVTTPGPQRETLEADGAAGIALIIA